VTVFVVFEGKKVASRKTTLMVPYRNV